MKRFVMIVLFLSIGLLRLTPIYAQVYPCAGPGPGEVIVGQTQAGNGIASIPLCKRVQPRTPQTSQASQGPIFVPGVYGALAYDRKTQTLSIEYGRENSKAAGRDALQSCKLKGGSSCELITTFMGTISVVADADDHLFVGKDSISVPKAIRQAFSDCNKQSRVGWCLLTSPPVMFGMVPPSEQLNGLDVKELLRDSDSNEFNMRAIIEAQQLASDLTALSQRMDTRDYWGATAADSEGFFSAYNQPDQRTAESKALKGCGSKECKLTQVFKNTCAGIAWPTEKENGLLLEIAMDIDPATAKINARTQCTAKYGACDVQAWCSGRRYAQSNPDTTSQLSTY
jgi:hypothetical protein